MAEALGTAAAAARKELFLGRMVEFEVEATKRAISDLERRLGERRLIYGEILCV